MGCHPRCTTHHSGLDDVLATFLRYFFARQPPSYFWCHQLPQNQTFSSTSGAFHVQSALRFLVNHKSQTDEDCGHFFVAPLFLVWKSLELEEVGPFWRNVAPWFKLKQLLHP